jgi:hypothetical protein
MPTQNPKISAYVPSIVYESFKQYEKEHGGSMSQAVIQLLADYFGIDLSNSTIKSTGGLQSRLENLENEMKELRIALTDLSNKVDHGIYEGSSLKENKHSNLEFLSASSSTDVDNAPHTIEDYSETTEIPPGDSSNEEALHETFLPLDKQEETLHTITSSVEGEPKSELLLQLEIEQIPSELPSDIRHEDVNKNIPPLSTAKISKRFSLSPAMLNKASKYESAKLKEYTASKDPDQIPWIYSPSKKRFYPLHKPSSSQVDY